MKSTIVSMLIVLCVMAIVPMILIGDNDLLAKFGLGGNGDFKSMRDKAPKNLTNVTTDQKVKVYKWRDENGIMQFTNTPPPEAQNVETVELAPNTNIMKAVEVPEEEPETTTTSGPKVMATGNPYTPGGMKDMVDTTSAIKESMNERQLEQQKMLEQMFGNQ